jgi:hypothetical protein
MGMSQTFPDVSFRNAAPDGWLCLDIGKLEVLPRREGGKSGSRSKSGAAPATVVEIRVTAKGHWEDPGKAPHVVWQQTSPEPGNQP